MRCAARPVEQGATVRRWHISLTAGIAMVLLLSACGGGDGGPDLPRRDPLRKGSQYVALGDSYTTAPRTGPVAARDGCMQSTTNYPHQVATRLGLTLIDVSCSGATTQHVTNPQVIGAVRRPPQLAAVSHTTDLVTISLGANDFNTFGAVIFSCTGIRARNPAGAPCAAVDTAKGKGSVVERRISQIEALLVTVIRLTMKRASTARVVVVGYPQFFPATGPCAQLPLATGDFRFAHRVNELLVRAQRKAATKTKADYVNVFAATRGHDICSDEPWIAGLKPTRSDALPYHPYPEEQRVVTELVVDLLD